MANRVRILESLNKPSGRVLVTGVGYKVQVVEPGTTTAVTVYQAATGGSTWSWFGTDPSTATGTGDVLPFTADPATTGTPVAGGEMWVDEQRLELRVLTLAGVQVLRRPLELVSAATLHSVESGTVPLITVADIAEPAVAAHRLGGSNVGPDNTIEAMEAIIAQGHRLTDGGDVRVGADGTLISMHDATIDRTTSSSGNVADHTAQSIKNVAIDAGAWFAPSWRSDLRVPYFEDILLTAKRRGVVCTPEVKVPAAGPGMLALIQKHKMQNQVLVGSFTLTDLDPFVAAGIKTYALVTSAVSAATLAAAGYTYVSYDFTQAFATSGWIASLIAAGLKPAPYTPVRKSDWEAQQALGAVLTWSDDPMYLAGTAPSLAADPFKSQSWSHGMFNINSPSAARGTFTAPKWFSLDMAGNAVVHQGWTRLDDSYTLTWRMKIDTLGSDASRMGLLCFSMPDDKAYDGIAGGADNGYHVICRAQASNQLGLFKMVNGVSTQLAGANGTAIVAGGEATFSLVVTPTQITYTRTDTAQALAVQTDSTFRGEHLALGKIGGGAGADITCSFADLTIA